MENYYEWELFKEIYLEDSFVLDVMETKDNLSFRMEFVLCEGHLLYQNPKPSERYCYRRGVLEFKEIKEKKIIRTSNKLPFKDANDENDYGNIDVFYKKSGVYHMEGDWGKLIIKCKKINIYFS